MFTYFVTSKCRCNEGSSRSSHDLRKKKLKRSLNATAKIQICRIWEYVHVQKDTELLDRVGCTRRKGAGPGAPARWLTWSTSCRSSWRWTCSVSTWSAAWWCRAGTTTAWARSTPSTTSWCTGGRTTPPGTSTWRGTTGCCRPTSTPTSLSSTHWGTRWSPLKSGSKWGLFLESNWCDDYITQLTITQSLECLEVKIFYCNVWSQPLSLHASSFFERSEVDFIWIVVIYRAEKVRLMDYAGEHACNSQAP